MDLVSKSASLWRHLTAALTFVPVPWASMYSTCSGDTPASW